MTLRKAQRYRPTLEDDQPDDPILSQLQAKYHLIKMDHGDDQPADLISIAVALLALVMMLAWVFAFSGGALR